MSEKKPYVIVTENDETSLVIFLDGVFEPQYQREFAHSEGWKLAYRYARRGYLVCMDGHYWGASTSGWYRVSEEEANRMCAPDPIYGTPGTRLVRFDRYDPDSLSHAVLVAEALAASEVSA